MKRTLLIAFVAVLVTAIAGGAATFALFKAGSTPQSSDFTAGTVKLQGDRDNQDTVPGPMFYGPSDDPTGAYPDWEDSDGAWAPGDSAHKVFQIENKGSLDATLEKVIATLESGSSALADALQVVVTNGPMEDDLSNVIAEGPVSSFFGDGIDISEAGISLVAYDPVELWGGLASLHFYVTLPTTSGNSLQGATAKVTFSVYVEQTTNHP